MDEITQSFINDFGKETYEKVISAANYHGNEINNKKIGHPFKHALLICIGYQCMEIPEYKEWHNLNSVNWQKMKTWIKENANLKIYKGDLDYLALAAGAYNEYME